MTALARHRPGGGRAPARASRRIVPEGAAVLEPAGTAPGVVVPPATATARRSSCCPGRRASCTSMWPPAVATRALPRGRGAGAPTTSSRMLRLFGIPESEIAETLRVAESEVDGLDALEVTTCLRRGEVEVVVRHEPGGEAAWEGLARADRGAPRATRSSRPTARRSTTRWRSCCRAAGSRWPSPAPAA